MNKAWTELIFEENKISCVVYPVYYPEGQTKEDWLENFFIYMEKYATIKTDLLCSYFIYLLLCRLSLTVLFQMYAHHEHYCSGWRCCASYHATNSRGITYQLRINELKNVPSEMYLRLKTPPEKTWTRFNPCASL